MIVVEPRALSPKPIAGSYCIPLFVLLVLLVSCNTKINSPVRLKNIPKQAFWIGGPDGGDWYVVQSIHPHRNMAIIDIYNDQNGSLIASKRFTLICITETSKDLMFLKDDIKTQIDYFDGENIHLKPSPGKAECYLH